MAGAQPGFAAPAPAADGGGELFTRGGLNAPDTRGLSMVAKHIDKLQKEKEQRGMDKLGLMLPQLSAATHAIALQECNWDEEKAVSMLRLFVDTKSEELHKLDKERRRYIKKATEKKSVARRDSSGGGSGGSDSDSEDGGSSSSSEEDRKKSKKRSRDSKSDRHKGKDKKRRKEKEKASRRKSSKRHRKEKKAVKREDSKRSGGDKSKPKEYEYGKFGVIRETDFYAKRPEFMLWALEVKKVDVESLPRFEEKELFRSYMEDYNTATMIHRKYYNLEAYEQEKAAKSAAQRNGGGGGGGERTAFDDEAERKEELLAERERAHAERLRAAYDELHTTDKAQAMREQEMMRAKMALAYRTGDQKEAARLAERLKPDEK